MKTRNIIVAAGIALVAAGCDRADSPFKSENSPRPIEPASAPELRARSAETSVAPVGESQASDETRKDASKATAEDLKTQRDAIVDMLYKQYGGSDMARTQSADSLSVKADRASFKSHCETAGKGDKVMSTDDKVKTFLAQPEVAAKCAEVARLNDEISAAKKLK